MMKPNESDNEEVDPHFEPIIYLPEVEVTTFEEDETVLWHCRAKLYRYDMSEEPAQWKERGLGVVKFLVHNTNGAVRLIMRREKIFKVCANHHILPQLDLKPHSGCDRAWVWSTPADFADQESKMELFAIRFKELQEAHEFQEQFLKAQRVMAALQEEMLKKQSDQCSDDSDDTGSETNDEPPAKGDGVGVAAVEKDAQPPAKDDKIGVELAEKTSKLVL